MASAADEKEKERPRCNVCGIVLTTVAEAKIGVHIACVAEKKYKTIKIPSPTYRNL